MDYIPLDSFSHYSDCAAFVSDLGYNLVELKITPQKGVVRISAVVSSKDSSVLLGVNDCAKVHRALLTHLEEILGHDDIAMELSSPGMERNIKNAAEFVFFVGRKIRVFSRSSSDWIYGTILSSDKNRLSLKMDDGSTKEFSFDDIAKAKFLGA